MTDYSAASDALMRDVHKGVHAVRAQLKDRKKQARAKKTQCGNSDCHEEESTGNVLRACSRCHMQYCRDYMHTHRRFALDLILLRSIRYCSTQCQQYDWKNHKKSCASFSDPPLCNLFDPKRKVLGCSYIECPILARGTQDGIGCWATPNGPATCKLARKPGNAFMHRPSKDDTYDMMMLDMMPGIPGSWFDIRLMVQNRTKGPMLLLGSEIVAVIKSSHREAFLGGIRDGETHLPAKELNGTATIAQLPSYVDLTALNGKKLKEGGNLVKNEVQRSAYAAALIDEDACAVLLQPTEHAILEVQFRLGGIQEVSLEFHAWAMLDHFIVPCLPYSTTLPGPYRGIARRTDKEVEDLLIKMRAPILHDDADDWYSDYVTRGERAHITSHFGEARANIICSGTDMMMHMLMDMASSKK